MPRRLYIGPAAVQQAQRQIQRGRYFVYGVLTGALSLYLILEVLIG